MKLTTNGRYAVMALVDIAHHDHGKPISLSDIAIRQEIPVNYLEQIFVKLRRSGLVTSVRGPGGGYKLARNTDATRISDIIFAVEESIKVTRCQNHSGAGCREDHTRCLVHDLWEGLENQIYGYLRAVTLKDVCNRSLPLQNNVINLNKAGAE